MKTPEEIKKGLECGDCKNCSYKRLISCTEGVRADALDYIQQLEAQVPQWISVEDRLPRAYETVIVFATGTDGCWYSNTAYHDGARWRGYGSRLDTVRYWMRMPEPPKEDEK